MRACIVYFLLMALGLSSACAHKKQATLDPFVPVAADADRSGLALAELEKGLGEYRSHCGGCHMLYPSEHKPADQWPHWVQEMSERSHLSPEEAKRITDYLVALAGRSPSSLTSPPHS